MNDSFYTEGELKEIGFAHIGTNILVSRKASIYGAKNISLGSHVRIDDFTILSGKITIGSYVHISAYTALYAGFGIKIGNFCGISPRCTLLSGSDDFSGEYMISPMVPKELSRVTGDVIKLNDYVQIGAHSMVMPGIEIGQGAVVGSMSCVRRGNLEEWWIYGGNPAVKLKPRSRKLLEVAQKMLTPSGENIN